MDILSKQRFTNVLIIILIIINIGSLSFIWYKEAQRPPLPPSPPNPPNLENVNQFLYRELNLNKEQEQKFDELRKEHFETTRKLDDKIAAYKKEILSESFKQKPDMQKIKALSDSVGSVQKGYELFLSSHFQNIHAVSMPICRCRIIRCDPAVPITQPTGTEQSSEGV